VSYLSSRSPHIAVDLLRFETGSENKMATARLRPQMMRLTDAAANRIKSVMANAGRPIVGVRVGVKNGGCAGMAYTMEYAEKVEPSDEVVEDKGVRVPY
jgi:iron-sulfur cluster assembly protein